MEALRGICHIIESSVTKLFKKLFSNLVSQCNFLKISLLDLQVLHKSNISDSSFSSVVYPYLNRFAKF